MRIIQLQRQLNLGELRIAVHQGGNDALDETIIELIVRERDEEGQLRDNDTLCSIAYDMLEKDRFVAHGFKYEDSIGYQLGVRSNAVGDVIAIYRRTLGDGMNEQCFLVDTVGFKSLETEEAKRICLMSMAERSLDSLKQTHGG